MSLRFSVSPWRSISGIVANEKNPLIHSFGSYGLSVLSSPSSVFSISSKSLFRRRVSCSSLHDTALRCEIPLSGRLHSMLLFITADCPWNWGCVCYHCELDIRCTAVLGRIWLISFEENFFIINYLECENSGVEDELVGYIFGKKKATDVAHSWVPMLYHCFLETFLVCLRCKSSVFCTLTLLFLEFFCILLRITGNSIHFERILAFYSVWVQKVARKIMAYSSSKMTWLSSAQFASANCSPLNWTRVETNWITCKSLSGWEFTIRGLFRDGTYCSFERLCSLSCQCMETCRAERGHCCWCHVWKWLWYLSFAQVSCGLIR